MENKNLLENQTSVFDPSHLLVQTDSHNAIHLKILSPVKIPTQIFLQKLSEVQEKQTKDSRKAIWVHLNCSNLSFIQTLLQKDYNIHRGHKSDVALYKWTALNKDSIPQFSRIFIGCGALVIRNQHVFLVQQKSGDRKGFFGLPGGRSDPGEFIQQAVQRQLIQETGMKGKFEYIVYFRQLPKSLWGSADVYFVSLVTVEESQFENIKLCENEISQYKWVHLKDYQQFIKENGFGTQVHVGSYITELYKKGCDFSNKSNLTRPKLYKPNTNIIMMEHLLAGKNFSSL